MDKYYNEKQIAVALDAWMSMNLILNMKGMIPNAHEFVSYLREGLYPDPFATVVDTTSQHTEDNTSTRQEVSQNASIDTPTDVIDIQDPQEGLVCDSCQ